MNRNNLYLRLSGLIVLMTIAACVIPSQSLPPAPTTNSNSIETFIAGTAQVSAQQTEQANPVSATATSVPTEVPTSTPKISVSGTSLIVREDQSTLFIDHKAGIQLVIPAGWMSLRLNEEEYFKAFTQDVVLQNQAFIDRLTIIRDDDPDYFRLDAIDIRPGHMPNGILSNINVVFEPGDIRSLEKWEQAERDRYHPFANFKFISSSYPHINNGMRVLVIEQSWSASGDAGVIYYRGVFFSFPTGAVILDFYTNLDFKDTVLPDLEQVVNSVTMLNP